MRHQIKGARGFEESDAAVGSQYQDALERIDPVSALFLSDQDILLVRQLPGRGWTGTQLAPRGPVMHLFPSADRSRAVFFVRLKSLSKNDPHGNPHGD
jgi:hypothetical protein